MLQECDSDFICTIFFLCFGLMYVISGILFCVIWVHVLARLILVLMVVG